MPWSIKRSLWIAHMKNSPRECSLASVPRDIIREIQSYLVDLTLSKFPKSEPFSVPETPPFPQPLQLDVYDENLLDDDAYSNPHVSPSIVGNSFQHFPSEFNLNYMPASSWKIDDDSDDRSIVLWEQYSCGEDNKPETASSTNQENQTCFWLE